jgi:hypothetical protein
MALRVGLHNGTLDEIVGSGYFHLEQMDEGSWCLNFATPKASGTVWLSARGKIKAQYEVTPNA